MFERAGNFPRGSITGFFTVLVEGDDFNEPISDAARAILDGHILLSRELGATGHYPAIDILNSVSRLATRVSTTEQAQAAVKLRKILPAYHQSEDLIHLGAYAAGTDATLDTAIRLRPQLMEFLKQSLDTTEKIGKHAGHCKLKRRPAKDVKKFSVRLRRVLDWRGVQIQLERARLGAPPSLAASGGCGAGGGRP